MWVSAIGPIKVALAQPFNNQFERWNNRTFKFVVNIGPICNAQNKNHWIDDHCRFYITIKHADVPIGNHTGT